MAQTGPASVRPTAAPASERGSAGRGYWLAAAGLLVALGWAYAPSLRVFADRWAYDPRYSHGYLVPLFALGLLWLRREKLAAAAVTPSWWGLAVVALGFAIRMAATALYNDWLDGISLVVTLAGVVVLLGGATAWRWAWPAVAFLFFMIPLPFRLEIAAGGPLQGLATKASTYLLQTVGLPALGTGNVIQMSRGTIGVVEACSGLSMMILFVALATGVAMLVNRPLIDRLLLVASALPIAILVNIFRITLTGFLSETVGERVADVVYHDLAGWLMMPAALLLLGLELWFLDHALVPAEEKETAEDLSKSVLAAGGRAGMSETRRARSPVARPEGGVGG